MVLALKTKSLRRLRFRIRRRWARRGEPHEVFLSAGAEFLPYRGAFAYFLRRPTGFDHIDARLANLRIATSLLQECDVTYFLVEELGYGRTYLGIDGDSTELVRAAFAEAARELPITIRTRWGRDGEIVAIEVHQKYIVPTTGQRFASRFSCVLEPWSPDEFTGAWAAPRLNGRVADLSETARSQVIDVDVGGLALPSFWELRMPSIFDISFPIDVVYMWVDGADPAWQQRKMARLGEEIAGLSAEAVSAVRFDQSDELRYSLRTLERYAPWVRNVFLVTDRQQPAWLDPSGRVTLVDHREILPAEAIPCFNSHAITAGLHRIEGLSEHFLLFNDDVMLGRLVAPQDFFASNGAAKFFPSKAALPSRTDAQEDPPVVGARRRSAQIVAELTGLEPRFGFKHTPVAFQRSLLGELAASIPAWRSTELAPFRSSRDVVPEWLHHWIGYARGRCVPAHIEYGYFDIGNSAAVKQLGSISRKAVRPAVLCVNDVTDDLVDGRHRHEVLKGMLELMFPWESDAERASSVRDRLHRTDGHHPVPLSEDGAV
ncbi:MAG: hypothetical protein EA388_11690 [Nitriliruptor sp.]|nr:MAG: hypothetical protein EA388_11690 [Nitriliruptor sp.]